MQRVGKLKTGGEIKLKDFLDKLDVFLNKYDPKFKYDYTGKDNYTEIILQINITEED
tara:strand:- start:143 stop:313 length:171 start_codon:yes stop_codon:yes gene_type:complete